jgi:hypothetical protein
MKILGMPADVEIHPVRVRALEDLAKVITSSFQTRHKVKSQE